MHRAFFHDGRSLSDARTYASIAAAHDISIARVNERLVDRTIRRIARYEAGRVRRLGITTYPALLLHVRDGAVPITTRLRSGEQLAETLRAYEHLAVGRLVPHD
jgi:protein-disulfide isomerase-like protein with CxxC motif